MTSRRLEHDWFNRPLPDNVSIGERSWLYSSFSLLHCRSKHQIALRIGSDSGVYAGTMFDLGANGSVEIGDYCSVVGATIRTDGRVVIEDYAFVAHEVVAADDPFAMPPLEHQQCVEGNSPLSIIIRRNAWICMRAILLRGADIGEGAVVGAGAVVASAVPPYAIVVGNPARVVSWAKPRTEGVHP
jgi:acetyltransferase-like isoleucine patch superfamily enzyme